MTRKVLISDLALNDLDSISAYIGGYSPRASVRFLEEARQAFSPLAEMSGIGVTRSKNNPLMAGMKMWSVPGFPAYLIFYMSTSGTIDIIRVLHGGQNIAELPGPAGGDPAS